MKARIVLAVMFAVMLLPGGAASADSGGISGVTGGISLDPPWGGRLWIELSVHQVDPLTHEAKGMIQARDL